MITTSPTPSSSADRSRHALVVQPHVHVLAEPPLLVDHAEAQPGELPVEVEQHLRQRGAVGRHHLLVPRVAAQRRGDPDLHRVSPSSTE